MARRKGRDLSPDEAALWRQVKQTLKPLRAEHPGSNPVPSPAPNTPAEPQPALPPRLPPRPQRQPPAPPQMDRRRQDKLRRGKIEPEARLDLHGMTSERAHRALVTFLVDAQAQGLRLVLVITGKGRPGADAMVPERLGILRHNLPHWLAASPLVGRILEVKPAHARHGGSGAFYVYLRRNRASEAP